ncbi:MAG: GGDEF domain-containing protein [Planctomycetota bacterium]
MSHKFLTTFDPSPLGLQRLYACLLLAMLAPLALLHAVLWALGATTPLAMAVEASIALLAWRLLVAATDVGHRRRAIAPSLALSAIGVLGIVAAFETGGVGSPQVILVVATTAFAGLLFDGTTLIRLTTTLVLTYAVFALALPHGITSAALETQRGTPFLAWQRLPVTALAALAQNVVYLCLAAYTAHAAKTRLHTQWAQMQQRARRDVLTQLPNRLGFQEDLLRVMEQPAAVEIPMAVLMVDLDHFKQVNDRYGHAIGDDVLRHTGQILRETVGPMDHVARLGGEEFVVAAMATDTHHAVDLAGRIVRAFRTHPWNHVRADLKVTCSVGIAVLTPDVVRGGARGALALALERADGALYHVKGNGRDGYYLAPDVAAAPLAATGTPRTLSLDRGPSGAPTPR